MLAEEPATNDDEADDDAGADEVAAEVEAEAEAEDVDDSIGMVSVEG